MAKEIKTEILINATPEKVWSILTDFAAYPDWNPFIKSVKGKVKAGKKITVRLEQANGNGMTFQPMVVTFEPNKEFSWLGNLFIPGLFDGAHKFELTDNGNGTTTFRHSEKFNGILVFLFSKMLDTNTLNSFKLMNEQIKLRCEQQ